MSRRGRERLRLWIDKLRTNSLGSSVETPHQTSDLQESPLTNSVDAYYKQKAQSDLQALYRFAVQTRSIAIRDVFAKASSIENLDLEELLNVVRGLDTDLTDEGKQSLRSKFEVQVLLALAALLANTARSDLDTYAAVLLYDFVYSLCGPTRFSDQHKLLYVEALHESGHFERAESFAYEHSLGEIAPLQPELLALQTIRQDSSSSIHDWLQKLNELYIALDMTQVQLLDDASLPLLDRLTAGVTDRVDGPKVTVIMPTFCPGPGMRTAIRGLLEQTWHNLEIIVVNDASPSDYRHVFSGLEQLDPRIRVIHQENNAGAYVARNAGLAEATGDFITTADDDDWSHPDKIAAQVSALLDDQQIVATLSEHIRTTEQLEFRRVNLAARYLQVNYSSLMFRRQIVDEIGGWDTVNRGADSEFLMRLRKYYGSEKVARLRAQPLAFSRIWKGSLTSDEMYRGFTATPRILHIWAIRQWHWDLARVGLKPTRRVNSSRPYSVPSTFEAGQRGKDLGLFDVIYVTDFFRQAKYVDYVLQEMKTLTRKRLRVGYVHLDSPRTTKVAGLPRPLLQSQFQGEISQVSLEDSAETRLLVVFDSAVGMFTDQSQSQIRSHRSILVERQLPTLSGAPDRSPTNYMQTLSHLDQTFDSYFQIVGATNRDQVKVAAHVPPPRLLQNSLMWRTHVDQNVVEILPPNGKPVVGFNTYGNKYRWPRNEKVFRDVYISDLYETRFHGQLEPAFNKFGRDMFTTTQIFDYHQTPSDVFLKDIHFWVYYPDPRLQDDVWEPVLLAMNAGKVVILPPSLENTYQHGAVYAQPSDVGDIVSKLSVDSQEFEKQARRGQDFVESLFSANAFYERVSQLLPGVG